jgi:hypothetical protein
MSVLDWSKFSKMSGGRNPLFECPDSYRHLKDCQAFPRAKPETFAKVSIVSVVV